MSVCLKCGRASEDKPGQKYCGNGGDKDNDHDWRSEASLTNEERITVAHRRASRLQAEASARARENAWEERLRAEGAASERAKVVAWLRWQAGEWGGGIGAATLETAADAIKRADHDTRPTKGGE
jgi:hypothetical protein